MAAGWFAANKAADKITTVMQLSIFKYKDLIIVANITILGHHGYY
jgi:hypothetical protein